MALARRINADAVSLERDQAIAKAKLDARTAHDQVRFWDGRADYEASENARGRMDVALDELLALGVGR